MLKTKPATGGEVTIAGLFRKRCLASTMVISLFMGGALAQTGTETPAYRDTSLSFEARARDLVSRMTLEEKASQLVNDAPAIRRLGVREYNWWNEGLHGVAAAGYATVFPQAIGMAATWNAPLIQDVADIIGVEFRAKYVENLHRFGGSDWFGGLTVWSPNINIFRDPRWGRGQETYGEDPYLTLRLGVSFVKGLQGDDPRYLRTVATPKHFAVHSGPEPDRHKEDVHPSAHDLEDTYLPAFRATVMEGGANSVMCAYNSVNGVPACANKELLTHYLRDEWGFKGYVVSDCEAVADVYQAEHHGYTRTPEEAIAATFKAGMDLLCNFVPETEHILGAVRQGLIDESVLDKSLQRLFTARMRLGQFDPPADVFPKITARDNDTPAHRAMALRTARESLVLLKNNDGLLPIRSAPKTIAVIGRNADSLDALVGNYNGTPSHPVTILDGIRARFPDSRVVYAGGTGLLDPAQFPVPDNALCVNARCSKKGLKAEHFATADMSGTPVIERVETNARVVWEGERRKSAIRWSGYLKAPETGEYHFRFDANGGYRIWVDDKLIVDAWKVDWRPAIISGAVTLKAGKTYPIRVESFQRQDRGDERLVWSVPGDRGAEEAMGAVQNADLVIFVAGLTAMLEGEEMPLDVPGFAGGDRTSLDLPAVQQRLLENVTATGKPVVLVLTNGSAMSVNWADKHVPAIIEAWYPGGQGGQAVAELIAGDFSPAGRLPVTFYRSVDALPAFGDYNMKGRTYRYFNGEVLYPFGYGLSYTTFNYGNARVSSKRVGAKDTVKISVDVTNNGGMDGDEVVQLYISHPGVDGAPIRALAGFERVRLAKGQVKTVQFTLRGRELSIVDSEGVRRIVPGAVDVWIGGGQTVDRKGLVKVPGVKTAFEITSAATIR